MDQSSFEGIEPTEVIPAPNRGRGRPRGTKGKFRSTLDKALRSRWQEAFTQLMIGVGERDPTCTRLYWERVMPAPRRMAIELSTADNKPLSIESPADARAAMAQVLSMVAAGELASDEADELITACGKYLAASAINTIGGRDPAMAGGEDPRKVFSEKLARIIEARQAPADEPIGFDNPHSEDQSPVCGLKPQTPPAHSIAAIRARMEAVRDAPEPDADAIAGLQDDLEALMRKLEGNDGPGNSE